MGGKGRERRKRREQQKRSRKATKAADEKMAKKATLTSPLTADPPPLSVSRPEAVEIQNLVKVCEIFGSLLVAALPSVKSFGFGFEQAMGYPLFATYEEAHRFAVNNFLRPDFALAIASGFLLVGAVFFIYFLVRLTRRPTIDCWSVGYFLMAIATFNLSCILAGVFYGNQRIKVNFEGARLVCGKASEDDGCGWEVMAKENGAMCYFVTDDRPGNRRVHCRDNNQWQYVEF